MTRKLALALTAAFAVALPVAGCGDDADDGGGSGGVNVAQAAKATQAKGTARMTMVMKFSGLGLPSGGQIKAQGVTALGEPKLNFTMDVGQLARMAGAPAGSIKDAKLQVVLDGADFSVRLPKIEGLTLPGGKRYIVGDIVEIAESFGIDTKGLGKLFAFDPAAQLRQLQSSTELEDLGDEKVGGAETTHYRGSVKLRDFVEKLSAEERKAVEDALDKLNALGGGQTGEQLLDQETPFDLWVDDQSVVRRLKQTVRIPGQQGVPGGRFDMTYELSDFGAKLELPKPPASQSLDVRELLSGLLAGGLGGGQKTD